MDKQLDNKDFMFVYNVELAKFLIDKGNRYVTIAKEPRNLKTFTLFHRNKKMEQDLKEYKSLGDKQIQ